MYKKNEVMRKESMKIRAIEDFYTNGVVENLEEILKEKKDALINKMMKYVEENTQPILDKEGNQIDTYVAYNVISVNNLFFKPITGSTCLSPKYNAEKLAIVFDFYNYLLQNINEKIGKFPSSISSFCKLAGISTSTLKAYSESQDLKMREVVQMIYDQVGDENLTMGQLGMVRESMTKYKLSTQNNMKEKEKGNSTNINVLNISSKEELDSRIERYKTLLNDNGVGK